MRTIGSVPSGVAKGVHRGVHIGEWLIFHDGVGST